MVDQYDATIEKIYSAATGADAWENALHAIEDLTGSVGAVIGFIPAKDGQVPFNLAGRFTAEQCATYSRLYQPICRRTRYMIDHPSQDVVYDSLLITEEDMNTDPVYDWFAQHDLRYFVGSALPPTRSHHAVFTLQRSHELGHVQARDIELFKQLKVHVGRALTLADQISQLRTFESFSTSVIEALPQALIALDERGYVLFVNDAAAGMARTGDGISIVAGRLLVGMDSEQRALDTLIRGATDGAHEASTGWTGISRSGGTPGYAVFVSPLKRVKDQFLAAEAKVLIVIHDLTRLRSIDPQMLTSLYGLTDTEARLASAIGAGHSLESAARCLNMRITTARSHLKSVFAKAGVNRQQDLVRLLTSLSAINL